MRADVLIIGSGCAGLYNALNLPQDKEIMIITKDIVEHSDVFHAQGCMSMQQSKYDCDDYIYDTMKARHF